MRGVEAEKISTINSIYMHRIFILICISRWYVRVFDGNDNSKEGWVPASILNIQPEDSAIYGDRADDAKYRRE